MSTPYTDPLGQEHAALRIEALRARQDATADTLGAVIMRAVAEAQAMKAAGGDAAAIAAGLEVVVREAWPKGRENEWKYLCQDCNDYGWRVHSCSGDDTCGRYRKHAEHEYVTPCWCAKGIAVTPKPKQDKDELEKVGKVKKLTRWGR